MKHKEYRDFLASVDVVCGECCSRSEDKCDNCPVRESVIELGKRVGVSELEKIYQKYGNCIFNLQNWVHAIEHGRITKEKETEVLNNVLTYFRDAHRVLEEYITKNMEE